MESVGRTLLAVVAGMALAFALVVAAGGLTDGA